MPSPSTGELPRPKSWDEFEGIVFDIFSRRWNHTTAQRHGRLGQPQKGVDIYGQPAGLDGRYAGVQCKRFENGRLTRQKAEAEIAQADAFSPPLAAYTIATTESRDAPLQQAVREINEARRARGIFLVDIFFWEDLCDALSHPDNHDLLRKHYAHFVHVFGDLAAAVNLDTARSVIIAEIEKATGGTIDSHYVMSAVNDLIHRISAAVLLESPLDEQRTTDLGPVLTGLFISAMDRNAFDEAKDLVGGVMSALIAAPSFTNAHANLLHPIGFACWNVGESGASLPRTAPIPGLLENVQTIFNVRLRHLIYHLLEYGPSSAVEELSWVLAYLAYETADAGGSDSIVCRIADIIHNDSQAYVSAQALHELASGLGYLRHATVPSDTEVLEWIDGLVDQLANLLTALDAPGGEVHRLLGNGGYFHRGRRRRRKPST
jgi:hypothetical protein